VEGNAVLRYNHYKKDVSGWVWVRCE
jgi:hypothetical protein